ncbi:oxidoreductase [Fructobacillus evanidus]|uniref:Short-chain dehydrogenase (YqjQ) n=1 Tax=Fructobacillus evanidus TaxID=3064281 RepID=A0ABM9MWI1_9LACO|nr:Short-chain dehydrogenase (YqjQ) [Fructobacillus sp. LMG 32999]CAK1228941.1 Short-chain dehydrogenase (YqjQ) [Fructobacillus sp. LMG 32999]CAK1231693.1 Short-chain dehydrogenase (YqjQ) [Fructobacillus sp. LMG 32999]CAK1231800.1 Short-chain dehydrogenase (YqjQ) [Fructobacillus sp. LMG 32999]CAK1232907.1 Short-chain dehydrogenase (YqjQ) [Fructobacillus sp. LMG 32999]
MPKVILVTGATSGIGHQTSQLLAEQGHIVYGAGRRVEKLADLEKVGVQPLKLDLTDEESCRQAVETILADQGRIDVLINNAGYGSYGAVEDVALEEAKRQFNVNLFGLAQLIKLVLPTMRKQQSGRIINVSSMAGRMASYFGAWYHATKFALEGFSDSLRMELKPFGIDVVLVEPGLIKTDWGLIAADHLASSAAGGPYERAARQTAGGMKKQYQGRLLSQPILIAKTLVKIVNQKQPRARYLLGFAAKPLVFLRTILPARWFDALMRHVVRG